MGHTSSKTGVFSIDLITVLEAGFPYGCLALPFDSTGLAEEARNDSSVRIESMLWPAREGGRMGPGGHRVAPIASTRARVAEAQAYFSTSLKTLLIAELLLKARQGGIRRCLRCHPTSKSKRPLTPRFSPCAVL